MKRLLLLTLFVIGAITIQAQIKDQPAGELRTYKRSGYAYMMDMGTPVKATQEGLVIDIVYDPDGTTIWMKDVIAYVPYQTWVKGTIEGNKIKMPMGQVIARLNSGAASLRLAVMDFDGDSYVADTSIEEVTFTIADEKISLDGMNEQHILSAYWDDNMSWVRVGDWESVYSPFDETPVTVPDNIQTTSMSIFAYNDKDEIDSQVLVGKDGNDVYIKGISPLVPEGWVKGTLENKTLTIPAGQFLGKSNDVPVYLCGSNSGNELCEIIFEYNQSDNLYTQQTKYIVANGRKNEMAYLDLYYDMTIGERVWETTTPAPATIEGIFEKDTDMEAMIFFRPSTYDINDNPIRKKNTFYQIFADINGEETIVTFDKTMYNLSDNLTDIPYYYNDDHYYFGYLDYLDMHVATFLMDITQWQHIGVRMGYTANGETNYSEIVWGDNPTAIKTTYTNEDIVSRKTYDLQGRMTSKHNKGIAIEVVTLADGRKIAYKKVK